MFGIEPIDVSLTRDLVMSDEAIAKASKAKRLKDGAYRCVVTKIEKDTSDSNNRMLVATLSPLADPEDLSSATNITFRKWVVLPVRNNDVSDHQPPESSVKTFGTFARACLGDKEVPRGPQKGEDGTYTFRGEPVSGDQYEQCVHRVNAEITLGATELWLTDGAEEVFVNTAPYCTIKTKPSDDGKLWYEANGFSNVPYRDTPPLSGIDNMFE